MCLSAPISPPSVSMSDHRETQTQSGTGQGIRYGVCDPAHFKGAGRPAHRRRAYSSPVRPASGRGAPCGGRHRLTGYLNCKGGHGLRTGAAFLSSQPVKLRWRPDRLAAYPHSSLRPLPLNGTIVLVSSLGQGQLRRVSCVLTPARLFCFFGGVYLSRQSGAGFFTSVH